MLTPLPDLLGVPLKQGSNWSRSRRFLHGQGEVCARSRARLFGHRVDYETAHSAFSIQPDSGGYQATFISASDGRKVASSSVTGLIPSLIAEIKAGGELVELGTVRFAHGPLARLVGRQGTGISVHYGETTVASFDQPAQTVTIEAIPDDLEALSIILVTCWAFIPIKA